MRRIWVASGALAAVVASASFLPAASSAPAPSPRSGEAGTTTAAASPPNLAWDDAQATAANGTIPPASPIPVCGSDTNRFLGELLGGDPLNYKIPYRLGDVVANQTQPTSTGGKQMMMSGVVAGDVFGTGDFPFDHPFGSDFNMDVAPDAPYAALAQEAGVGTNGHMHTELSEGGLPHTPATPTGPATGQTWAEMSDAARANVQDGFFPAHDERVLVMGRFVNDCGHNPFQTELHPLSFLAWSHTQGDRTVAQTYYSPYRETQLYNPDKTLSNKVNQTNRFKNFFTVPFPTGLIQTILRLQDGGAPPWGSQDYTQSWGLIEANKTSPADWIVCAPSGTSGTKLNVNYDFVARPGVQISATPDPATGCATMHTKLGTNVTPDPTLRVCTLPWDWLSKVAAEEAGVPSLDLKAVLAGYIKPQYQYRLDPDPIMDCYDPVKGAQVSNAPAGQNVTVDPTTEAPFYGRVEVFWTTDTPPSSSTTTSSSTTSSSVTTPDGTLTVAPATVPQGGTVNVSSTGWMPGSTVTISLDDGSVLGTLVADSSGGVSGAFTIPSSTSVGTHNVKADGTGANGNALNLATAITVTAAAPNSSFTPAPTTATPTTVVTGTLPVTGATVAGTVALAGALVLAGTGVTTLARRRREDGS